MIALLMRRWLAFALAATFLASPVRAQVGAAAPWQLKTPEGATVSYPQDAHGRPTVLLFWPSWCPFSRALQPYVQDIWTDYRDAGVNVWTINIMESGDPLQAMRERGLSFPLLLDGDPLIGSYGISRTPWFVVINGEGRIVYTRPADAPSPIDVAKAAREALNRLLGPRAVPLPTAYPPPYDLHLRQRGPSRLDAAAAADAEWQPWARAYLAAVDPAERVEGQTAYGPVADGKAAIAIARRIWSEAYGPEPTLAQAPFRSYRRNDLWLVAGTAVPGRLGQGYIVVLDVRSGAVVRLRGAASD